MKGEPQPLSFEQKLFFDKILAENYMKMKEIRPGARVPSAPFLGSANELIHTNLIQ